MSRSRKEEPGQLCLLDVIERVKAGRDLPGSMKRALSEDLRRSRFPRGVVAERMGIAIGRDISQAQIDAWTAPTKPLHRFPMEYLPAFCEASGEYGALRAVVEAAVCVMVVPVEVRRRLVEVERCRRQLEEEERMLKVLAILK
jgi:hypothetical protein